jgi:hypothetical protein
MKYGPMGILRFVTHPQVRISTDIPVPLWGLSDVDRTRAYQLSTQPWLPTTTRLISSAETKALETAAIVSVATGIAIEGARNTPYSFAVEKRIGLRIYSRTPPKRLRSRATETPNEFGRDEAGCSNSTWS